MLKTTASVRKLTRRFVVGGGIALAISATAVWWLRPRKPPLGMAIPEAFLLRGSTLTDNHPMVDIHSHPGRFFLTGASLDSLIMRMMRDGFEAERIADMRSNNVTAGLFSIVADLPVLGFEGGGLRSVRDFKPGEAYAEFQRQLARLQHLVDSGLVAVALSPEDIETAKLNRQSVAVLASEGADFVEHRLQRLGEAYAAGLRSIGLVHYRINQLGDIQTEAPRYNGLTTLGAEVVKEMNRLGMIIDLAHASFETCAHAVAASSAPVMVSHSNLMSNAVRSPRFLSKDHAALIASSGGIIGAWPAGIGSVSLADFVEQILRLVEHVGVDHVAVGTDMDANYKPVLTEYADYPLLAAALLFKGLGEIDTAKVLGGNFLRVFKEVSDQRRVEAAE